MELNIFIVQLYHYHTHAGHCDLPSRCVLFWQWRGMCV